MLSWNSLHILSKIVKPSLWLYFLLVCWVWATTLGCGDYSLQKNKDLKFFYCQVWWVTVAPHNAEDVVTQGLVPYKENDGVWEFHILHIYVYAYIYCIYTIIRSSKQAQNETLVPSLSKEGCDHRTADLHYPHDPHVLYLPGSGVWLVKRMDCE